MNPTFTLGRIAGVRIGVNWSWAIVFALIVWSLADTVFPAQNPGFSTGGYIAMAFAAAILFFSSLLLHELGHAVQARREGMQVENITLWLFGGVAQFKGEFPSAGAEFRVAIAGPVVTALLGTSFLAIAAVTQLTSSVDGVAAWLGYINLVLLAFNLLPALPLDGGRVLRSALWRTKRDFGWATRTSVDISRGFAFLLVALGIVLVFAGDAIGGVWLAFIGWFLLQAATLEGRHLLVRDALAGLRVRRDAATTGRRSSATDTRRAHEHRRRRGTLHGLSGRGRRPPGGSAAVQPRARHAAARVERSARRDSMLPEEEVATFGSGDAAIKALEKLAESPLQRGLVVDNGRLVGLLSISDFARLLAAAGRNTGAQARGSHSSL